MKDKDITSSESTELGHQPLTSPSSGYFDRVTARTAMSSHIVPEPGDKVQQHPQALTLSRVRVPLLQAVKASYGKAFTLSISALFITTKTVGARIELSEQQLQLWPGDVDKILPTDNLPRGSRAHITLGCANGVEAVQTGLDLLEFVKLEKAGNKGEQVGEIGGGKLLYFGNGMWMLVLSKKIDVRAIFSGYYGKGKLVPTQSTNKRGAAFSSCTII